VKPTMSRTKMTWMAIAITLRQLRSGRATMLPHSICKSEKVPSKVSFIRKADEPLYHPRSATVKSWDDAAGKRWAELREKYFWTIKFSTQLLISVWKIGPHCQLTSLPSTPCSCLHNFGAIDFFLGGGLQQHENCCTEQSSQNQIPARLAHENICRTAIFSGKFRHSKQISTTSEVVRGAL
jgi:hypothetical protein